MDEKEARRQRILDLSGILSPCIAGHAIMSVAFDNGATAIQVLKAHYTAGSYERCSAPFSSQSGAVGRVK